MPDEALQAAFEIKAACDDISRKLLRWHWEEKPGAHSVDALMKHLAQRQKESPDYYERLPELNGRTGWQQLDTTLCMRILLDPEKDAARPLDLLGNTPHPAAAKPEDSMLYYLINGDPVQRGRGGAGSGL